MDDAEAQAVMARFARAYFSKDAGQLRDAITADAQWLFAFGDDIPDGRVRCGLDGFMQGIGENEGLFARLRFENVVIRAFGDDEIVMTYLARGQYRGGVAFAVRGVELIRVERGRVARKDVFWKGRNPA